MEAIALLIGELVFLILAPMIAVIAEAIVSLVSGLLALLSTIFGRKAQEDSTGSSAHEVQQSPPPTRTAKAATVVSRVFAALAVLAFTIVLAVHFFFFEQGVRFAFEQVEDRAGISANCAEIDGSLLAGRVTLGQCSMQRLQHSTSSFDLSVESLTLDLDVLSMFGTATIETAELEGLSGWIRSDRSEAPEEAAEDEERPRRQFVIENLDVSDVELKIAGWNPDGNAFDIPVTIERVRISPLRSYLALFDVLFRSNASGTLDGAPFSLSTTATEDGRRTAWRAKQVPVASLGAMTGGLLSWFDAGTVDVFVDDEWQKNNATSIDMDWRLHFSDVSVAPPPGTSLTVEFVTGPLTRYVNSKNGEFPLEFSLKLDESQFEYRSSLAAAGLWSAVGGAVNNAGTLFGIQLDSAERTGEALKEGAKSILDRVRKPKDED